MASLYLLGVMDVDYYLSGKVRRVELADGTVLYDEDEGIETLDWRRRLYDLVHEYGLDDPQRQTPPGLLWAFVFPLLEEFAAKEE